LKRLISLYYYTWAESYGRYRKQGYNSDLQSFIRTWVVAFFLKNQLLSPWLVFCLSLVIHIF